MPGFVKSFAETGVRPKIHPSKAFTKQYVLDASQKQKLYGKGFDLLSKSGYKGNFETSNTVQKSFSVAKIQHKVFFVAEVQFFVLRDFSAQQC